MISVKAWYIQIRLDQLASEYIHIRAVPLVASPEFRGHYTTSFRARLTSRQRMELKPVVSWYPWCINCSIDSRNQIISTVVYTHSWMIHKYVIANVFCWWSWTGSRGGCSSFLHWNTVPVSLSIECTIPFYSRYCENLCQLQQYTCH